MRARIAFGAAAVAIVVYGYFSLATILGILRAPREYVSYGAFFESFAVVCGGLALFAPRAARVGFGLCALSFAIAQVVYRNFTASLVPAWLPAPVFWVDLTTLAFALAAVAMLLDRRARLAAGLTALMLVVFAVLVWVPHLVMHPRALGDWSEFAETLLIAASAAVIAAAPRVRSA
jgi:hypothetical protein